MARIFISGVARGSTSKNILIFLQGLKNGFTFSSFFFVFLACQLFLYFLFILVSIEYLFCRFLCLSLFYIIICVFENQFNWRFVFNCFLRKLYNIGTHAHVIQL